MSWDKSEAMEAERNGQEASTSNGGGLEKEKEAAAEEEKGQPEEKVPFYKLFSFADSADIFLMIIGSFGAMGNGLALPLMTVLFGEMINSFGSNQNNNSVVDVVSKVITTNINRPNLLNLYYSYSI